MIQPSEPSIFLRTGRLPMRQLETDRLLLRQFHQDDHKQITEWEQVFSSENRAQAFLDFCSESYRKWGMGPWAMVIKQVGTIAGNCGFVRVNFIENTGEVNYYVGPAHRGQGFACEALKGILTYGFTVLDLNCIQARCSVDNLISERVMQKAGMTFERTATTKDTSSPETFYLMMRTDFQAASSVPAE
jgi:[ribosomal protein S5]-alanine N-acetyltransferase